MSIHSNVINLSRIIQIHDNDFWLESVKALDILSENLLDYLFLLFR
jgi:hypothetical protein